jgi:hypothetical protein
MNRWSATKAFLRKTLGVDNIIEKLDAADSRRLKDEERWAMIEHRLVENTRALATLALVQANLIKELDALLEKSGTSSKMKGVSRKIDPDFTN